MNKETIKRKHAEDAKRLSEARFREAFDHAPIGMTLISRVGRWLRVNHAFCQMLGYSELELLGMNFKSLTHPEDLPENLKGFQKLLTGESDSFNMENRFFHKDGHIVRANISATVVFSAEKTPLYLITQIQDMTERKRVEEQLREGEERFRQLAENITEVFWMTNPDKNELLYLSPAYEKIWGRSCQSAYERPATWMEAIHPEDRERVIQSAMTDQVSGRYDQEYRILRPDGSIRWIRDRAFPIKDYSGRVYRVTGIAEDITERKEVGEALRESEERLRMAINAARMYTWDWDVKSGRVVRNGHHTAVYGADLPVAESDYPSFLLLIHPEDREKVEQARERLLQGKAFSHFDFRIVRSNGDIRWLETHGLPSYDSMGQIIRVLGITQDITERREAEEAIRESERQYRQFFESANDALLVADENGRYLDVNRRAEELLGYRRDELLNMGLADITPPETIPMGQARYEEFKRVGRMSGEYTMVRKDGARVQVEFSANRIAPGKYLSILRDITERKRAEEALKTSEERFRRYFALGLIGMAITSPSKGWIEVNDQICAILGYDRSELRQKTWAELTHPEDLAADLAHFNRVLSGEIDGYSIDKRFIRKDGQVVHATISVKCVRRPDGSIDYLVGLLQDTTERRRSEEALRISKDFSDNLIQTANVMILSLDTDGDIDIFNEAAETITGYTRSELKGKNWFEILVPKDRYPYVWEYFNRLVAGEMPKTFENPILTKSGEERHIIWQNNQIKVDGKVVATISFGNDITERKRAEEALRAAHAFRKAIEEAMPAGVIAVDSEGRQTYVNPSFCEMVGWSAEELIGGSPPFVFWPPEQIDQIRRIFEEHTNGHIKPGPVELVFRRRNEERFPVSLLVSPLLDHQGIPVGYLASVHDISPLKTSQEKLERRERQLSQAQRLAHLGSWSWDLQTDTVTWSDELYRICGVEPERFVPTYESLLHLIDPRDRKKVEKTIEKILQDGRPFDITYRLIGMDGIVRIHHTSGMVSVDPQGRPLSMVGVARDITEIKEAENTLRDSEERYRSLILNIPDAAWRVREDGEPIFISQNIEKIIGYTAEEVCSGGLDLAIRRIHPDDREQVTEAFKSLFSKKRKFDVEYRVRRKDGAWIWVHDRAVMTYQKDGVRYADGVISDVTERKKVEEALRKSDDRFRLIARATNDAIWDWDLTTNTVWWNESFKTLFGYQTQEIEPGVEGWSNRIHPEDRERVLAAAHAVIDGGERFWSAEYRFRRADGSYATIFDRGYVVHVQNGKPIRMIGAMMDMSERKQAEEALANYAERLQSLSGQLLEAQENERRRIARELHDEIGQSLTAVKLQLHAARRHPDQQASKLKECLELVDYTLSQVRSLSLDLHPPQLEELGLVATLRWHLDQQAHAANLTADFSADPLPTHLHPEIEIACFRVAQEALTNVVRHAQAGRVSVELRRRRAELHLIIKDDGRGFDVEAARHHAIQGTSIGLVGMQERVELAGGRLELKSSPRAGTRVHAVFPLADPASRKRLKWRKE